MEDEKLERIIFIDNGGRSIAACQSIPACENIIIICHGFRGAKENSGKLQPFVERLNNIGYGALAFDFSGSGASDGEFQDITLSRQAADLQRVIDHVSERYSQPIYLLGRSFGGSTVLAAGAGDPRVVGFILWSAPVLLEKTFRNLMSEAYDKMAGGQAVSVSDENGSFILEPDLIHDFELHDMDAYLQAVGDRPVLIIHGEDDETVAAENARYMEERLANARLHVVPGADHRFNGMTQLREDLTLAWLQAGT
ncbi:MAG: alpha/beta hydrolase [Deltaproteobacteria bacterium]